MDAGSEDEDELVVNPSLRVSVDMEWAVRGRGADRASVSFESDRELVTFLLRVLGGERVHELPDELCQRLVEQGVLVRARDVPKVAPLDLRLSSVRSSAGDRVAAPSSLAVSPHAYLSCDGVPPAAVELPSGVAAILPRARALWLRDARTGVCAVYDLSDEYGACVVRLLQQEIGIAELDPDLVGTLATAGILVPASAGATEPIVEDVPTPERLRADQFAVIRGLVHPVQLAAYRAYLRALAAEGWLRQDPSIPDRLRWTRYRDPLCEFLHAQIRPLIERIVGHPIKSTYSVYALYLPGATLARHLDRPQCRWNVSLVLDVEPETARDHCWPLHLETARGVQSVRLAPGDAVLYSGTEMWHWRDAQPPGHRTGAAFFHFVPVAFEGPLD